MAANEVNLCQELTNYRLLGVTRDHGAGAGDIWCIVKHSQGLMAWLGPPPPLPPVTHLARV